MRKVLLVDDDKDILALLHLVIDARVDCEIESTTSGREAIDIIRKNDIDVVVSDYNLQDSTGGVVCQEAVRKNKDTSFVLLSADTVDQKPDVEELCRVSKNGLFILKPFENDQLVFILRHITKENCKDFVEDEYIPVKAQSIISEFSQQDIYFRVNDKKLIKIVSCQNEDNQNKLEEYIERGANHFWVNREDFKRVVLGKISKFTSDLEEIEDVDIHIASTATIHETIRYLGIDQQIIDVSDLVIKNVLKTVKNEKQIWSLLSEALKGKGYIYKLAMLSSYISVGMFHQMEHNQELALFKLVTASMFQDIGLSKQEEAQIEDLNSLQFKEMTSTQQHLIKNHPEAACNAIEKMKGVYFDFRKVVLYHHERPGATAFHAKINLDGLGQLEKMFIISVDFAQKILRHEKIDQDLIEKELTYINETYHHGSFFKVHCAFKDLLGLS